MDTRRLLTGLLVGFALLALSKLYVGQRIEREITALADMLEASPDVTVYALDYTPGYWRGELRIDLDFRPTALAEDLAERQATRQLPPAASRLRGTLEVRQGPWLGRHGGLALAHIHRRVEVPPDLRAWLRDTITFDASLTLGGKWQLGLHIADAGGGGTPLGLRLTDLRGSVRSDRTFSRQSFEITADTLSLGLDTGAFQLGLSIDDFAIATRQERVMPGVWASDTLYSLARFKVSTRGLRVEWFDQSGTSEVRLHDGRMEVIGAGSLGPLQLGRVRFDHVILRQHLSRLDPDALSSMNAVSADDPPDTGLVALAQLLAGGPALTQSVRVALNATGEDLAMDLSLAITPAPADTPITTLLLSLQGEGRLQASEAMVRQAARVFVDYQAAEAILSEDPEEMAAVLAEVWLNEARSTAGLQLSDDGISATVRLTDGMATVDGLEPVALRTLLEPVLDSLRGHAYAVVMPDHTGRALYGTLELASGRFPDPYRMEVVAGGDRDVTAALGEPCAGLIDFGRPDLVLNFTAGTGPLYIYANSISDTTLTVRDPDGDWHCNDDVLGRGLNPGLEISQPRSGDYAIWLGTWERRPADSLLMFSERGMIEATIEN